MPPKRKAPASAASASANGSRAKRPANGLPAPPPTPPTPPALTSAVDGLIDWRGFPHIVEAIMGYSSWEARLAFRATCRHMHARLDLSRLEITLRPGAKACMIEGRTTTGFLVLTCPCNASLRRDGSEIWTIDERNIVTEPRSFRSFLLDISVTGQCPHNKHTLSKLVSELTSAPQHWPYALELGGKPAIPRRPARPAVAAARAHQLNLWPYARAPSVTLIPDEQGRITDMSWFAHWARVYAESWRAAPESFQDYAEFYLDVVVFPITGDEPLGHLFHKVVLTATVVYDFTPLAAREMPPPDLPQPNGNGNGNEGENADNVRMRSLVAHIRTALSVAPSCVHLAGLHALKPEHIAWLDPGYASGEARQPGGRNFETYLRDWVYEAGEEGMGPCKVLGKREGWGDVLRRNWTHE